MIHLVRSGSVAASAAFWLVLACAAACQSQTDNTAFDASVDAATASSPDSEFADAAQVTAYRELDAGGIADSATSDLHFAGGTCVVPIDAGWTIVDDAGASSDSGHCATDAGEPVYSLARPMGVGYGKAAREILPDHVAYLTFDDGPSEWTLDFLAILAQKQVRATFFVNARNLKGAAGLDGTYLDDANSTVTYRDVLKRVVDDGHAIGNHTVDHLDLAVQTADDAAMQLDLNEQLVSQALVRAGGQPRLLTLVRAPFGSPWHQRSPLPPDPTAANLMVGQLISLRGLNILWNLDSSDSLEWAQDESYTRVPGKAKVLPGAPTYADKVARIEATVLGDANVASGAGVVIIMHDTHNATRDALATVIDGLRANGYVFGTIEDYALWRWGRPSVDVTPGPSLFDACVPQSDWGCQLSDAKRSTNGTDEVCGRMWLAYQNAGGSSVLGDPQGAAVQSLAGVPTQSFAWATLQLHPENPIPCNIVVLPSASSF